MAYKVFQNGYQLPASDLNNYLMNQSVITFADSTARSSAITSPVEGMLTYLESTNSYEGWNGSAWVGVTSDAIQKSLLTTQGDLIVASGSSTPARLGIGSSGTYLKSNGTTAEWAAVASGGMQLLSTTTLSGASTLISGISGAYKTLVAIGSGITTSSSGNIKIETNSTIEWTGVSGGTAESNAGTIPFFQSVNTNGFAIELFDYANSTTSKKAIRVAGLGANTTAYGYSGGTSYGTITQLYFSPQYPYTFTGGTIKLYGVN